jgi:hypothetical protein
MEVNILSHITGASPACLFCMLQSPVLACPQRQQQQTASPSQAHARAKRMVLPAARSVQLASAATSAALALPVGSGHRLKGAASKVRWRSNKHISRLLAAHPAFHCNIAYCMQCHTMMVIIVYIVMLLLAAAVACAAPPAAVPNALWPASCAGMPYNAACRGQCSAGFTGSLATTCTADGTWSTVEGSCTHSEQCDHNCPALEVDCLNITQPSYYACRIVASMLQKSQMLLHCC